jgi:hypothetical protein
MRRWTPAGEDVSRDTDQAVSCVTTAWAVQRSFEGTSVSPRRWRTSAFTSDEEGHSGGASHESSAGGDGCAPSGVATVAAAVAATNADAIGSERSRRAVAGTAPV